VVSKHGQAGIFPGFALLMVNQVYWCQEVEEAFDQLAKGDKGAMKVGHQPCLLPVGSRDGQQAPTPACFPNVCTNCRHTMSDKSFS
jgi:hypothetical protein